MTQQEPIEAVATDGIVALFVNPETARQIAAAWEFTFASGGLDDTDRRAWLLDCSAIRNAAIRAEQQAQHEMPQVRYVPVVQERRLRVVGGEA